MGRLMVHAVDDPQSRWGVFGEARRLFTNGLRAVDTLLDAQLGSGGMREPDVKRRVDVDMLQALAPMTGLLICACRAPCWRGRCPVRLLSRHSILVRIFSFIAPAREKADVGNRETWNSIARCAERALEYVAMRRSILLSAVLAAAWHSRCSVLHDSQAPSKLDALTQRIALDSKMLAREVEKHGEEATAQRRADMLISTFKELAGFVTDRCGILSTSGQQFMALGRRQLAAESFGEASDSIKDWSSREQWWPEGLQTRLLFVIKGGFESQRKDLNLKSAQCWLLASRDTGNEMEALERANERFLAAEQFQEAAVCASRAESVAISLHE